MLVSPLAYFTDDCVWMTLTISFITIPIVPFWWFLEESIHWNISKGNVKEVKKQLRKIAKFNNVELDEKMVSEVLNEDVRHEADLIKSRISLQVHDELKAKSEELLGLKSEDLLQKQKPKIRDLFKTPKIRSITISLSIMWFTNVTCYYGLQLSTDQISGANVFLSYLILAFVEIPAVFISLPLIYRYFDNYRFFQKKICCLLK